MDAGNLQKVSIITRYQLPQNHLLLCESVSPHMCKMACISTRKMFMPEKHSEQLRALTQRKATQQTWKKKNNSHETCISHVNFSIWALQMWTTNRTTTTTTKRDRVERITAGMLSDESNCFDGWGN